MTGRVSRGIIRSVFKEWIVPYSKAYSVMEYFNDLREARRNSRWDTEQTGAYILAPSHCGKSHTCNKIYFSSFVIPEIRATATFRDDVPDGDIKKLQKRVVCARVPAKPTSGDFATMLLTAFDQPKWAHSRETVQQKIDRARDRADDLGNELLILDRFDQLTKQHDRETMKQASVIQEIIKNMIEDGWPLVLVGLPNAKKVIDNMQLKNRIKKLDLMPMKFVEDAEEFSRFLAGLEMLMLQHRMFDEPSGLCDGPITLRLYYASQGRLGILCNIVRDAAILASSECAVRIGIKHLKAAVDGYSLENGICVYNPFEEEDEDGIAADCMIRVAEDEKYYGPEYHDYFKPKKPRKRSFIPAAIH